MAWTYDDSLGANRDIVRSLIQDVDTNHQILQDEEIDYLLTLNSSSVLLAAASACEVAAAKFGRQLDRSALGVSDSPNTRAQFFLDLAERFRTQASLTGTSISEIFAGGRSIEGKEEIADDEDAIASRFRIGLFDHD